MPSVCVAELLVTVSYTKALSVAQKCINQKFMSPATIIHRSSCKVSDAALKQRNVR